jgi:Protein of unknown function (DUF3142)
MRRALLLPTLLLATCGRGPTTPATPTAEIPWAWERREDLRFLRAQEVAYLAATIGIDGQAIVWKPRMQPLRVSDGTRVIPVVRIEAKRPPDVRTVTRVADAIARIAARVKPRYVQIDFDATQSQRPYYALLLRALRSRLDPETKISITALASWCSDDRWLQPLPVDEAVPMLFRMGQDAPLVRDRVARGEDFAEPRCRTSLGIATDEPLDRARAAGRRVYVFHIHAWDEAAWHAAQKEIARWQ